MAPALDAPVVNDEALAGLAAAGADTSPAPQPHRHDHPLRTEADINDRCSGQAEQPVECGADAHVALSLRAADLDNQQPRREGGSASLQSAQPPQTSRRPRVPHEQALRASQTATSPTNRPETLLLGASARPRPSGF